MQYVYTMETRRKTTKFIPDKKIIDFKDLIVIFNLNLELLIPATLPRLSG